MNFFNKILVLASFILFTISVSAQSVGLVLSGGGAKGLYHIGVIKALEENSIPIDYVSGTSMGSIVAGMYAAGYSPDEMKDIFMTDDVKYWLTGKIQDHYLYYFKKQYPVPAMIRMNVDLVEMIKKRKSKSDSTSTQGVVDVTELSNNDHEKKKSNNVKFSVADGMMNGASSKDPNKAASMFPSTQMDIAFLYFFSSASSYCNNNFDSLFVPFSCISVDILKKRQFVWRKGDLGMAIRSSMAIPIVFKPVKVDSMLMYDGGLQNNFPWQEMKQDFDPNVIIGVKCVGDGADLSSITGQVEMLVMNKTNYDLPSEDGIMIERNVSVGMLDFSKASEIIEQGYQDAMKSMPIIKARIERRVPAEEVYMRRLAFKEALPVLQFDDFEITGLTQNQEEYITSQIGSKQTRNKESISFEEFKSDYLKILSEKTMEGDFPTAKYDSVKNLFSLDMQMYPKPSFTALLGLNISSTSINQAYIGLHYRNIGRISSIYTLDTYIGSFYSSIKGGARHNFYGGRAFYLESDFVYNFYDYARGNSQRISFSAADFGYSRLNDLYLSSLIGTPVGRVSKLEFRASVGHDQYSYIRVPSIQSNESPDRSGVNFFSLNLSLSRNSLNYVMYPTRGLHQRIAMFGDITREKFVGISLTNGQPDNGKFRNAMGGVSFMREQYFNLCDYFTIGYSVNALYSTKIDQSNSYMDFMMAPAYQPTVHSNTLYLPEFRNSSYAAVGLMPVIELNEKLYVKTGVYCYLPNLRNFQAVNDRLKYIISATAVYQSPIGAISFNYSRYTKMQSVSKADYFTFNIGTILFNKKGIIY